MSEYLPSFIVEPVLRQARRFSRLSGAEESPGFLPAVPDLQRWNPSRFWNTSPPPSFAEPGDPDAAHKETTVQSITRTIQLWANQLNGLDQIPSPPLEPMDDIRHQVSQPAIHDEPAPSLFPPLDAENSPSARPVLLEDQRSSSETSLNPAQELPYRSRRHEGSAREHSVSDPATARFEDPANSVSPGGGHDEYNDSDGYRRDGSGALPEDDGMGPVRQRINAIWSGPGTASDKSRLIHALMMERYQKERQSKGALFASLDQSRRPGTPSSVMSGASQDVAFNLSIEDLQPSYAPLDLDQSTDDLREPGRLPEPDLGCVHYKRNVKMQCNACERWYTCRLCHDEAENHTLPRRDTKHMLCMLCKTPQKVGQVCKSCQVQAGCYYCAICKLWNNDPAKSVYHCDDCGICRLGEGLGKDFFHCKTCAACMSIQAESTHKCIERSTKCDCPICGEYMFTSNKPVAFMRCGHSIHESCFADWCNASYKCPICSKSIANMESQFRRLDRHIEEQPMPEEYRDNRAYIFCNDCNSRSVAKYHWLGLKCTLCESYNTTQLELLGASETPQLQEQQQRAQQAGVSEAALTASQNHTPTNEMTQPVNIFDPSNRTLPLLPLETETDPQTPGSRSSLLLPHSPTNRSARSLSPVVGSYFGTGQRPIATAAINAPQRGTTPLEDDDDLDFWGRPNSPRQPGAIDLSRASESDSDEDETMDDDEGADEEEEEEEDSMDLIGHR